MDKRLLRSFASFAMVLLFTASLASAQLESPSADDVIRGVVTFIFGEEFPEYAVTTNGFLQFVVFPFVALFAVMYGIMTEIKIFKNTTVKMVISLTMSLVAGSWVLNQMRWFLMANATLGTWAFGLLMIFGIGLWFLGTFVTNIGLLSRPMKVVFGKELTEGIGRRAEMRDLMKRIRTLEDQSYMMNLSQAQSTGLINKINNLKERYRQLEKEETGKSSEGADIF